MKERVKRILKVFLLFVVLIIPFSYLSLVRADSGWDPGYDSGGGGGWSSSGGSDWGGGSSWSTGGSSRSRGSDYDYEGGGGAVLLVFFVVFVVIVVISILSESGNNTNNNITYSETYPDITEDRIKQYLPDYDLGSLKNMAYKKFLEIQNAWMNFDYDALRELCTDELYNTYKSQLKVLEMKNQKNIMTNFQLRENRIIDITASTETITVEVFMRVSFYDYVISTKTNQAVMGTKNAAITNNYKMKYVVSRNRKLNNKCPNCGAPVNANTSTDCEYCGSTIVFDSNDFVLSKKTNERTER